MASNEQNDLSDVDSRLTLALLLHVTRSLFTILIEIRGLDPFKLGTNLKVTGRYSCSGKPIHSKNVYSLTPKYGNAEV